MADHCWPTPTQETLKHSRVGLVQSLVGGHCNFPQGPGAHKVLFVPSKSPWQVRSLISTILHPSYHLVATSPLFLDMRYLVLIVGFNILLSMVVQQLVMILVFFQEKMSACFSIPPSCLKLFTLILFKNCWCISTTYQIKFKVISLAFMSLHNAFNNLMVKISAMKLLHIEIFTFCLTDYHQWECVIFFTGM